MTPDTIVALLLYIAGAALVSNVVSFKHVPLWAGALAIALWPVVAAVLFFPTIRRS